MSLVSDALKKAQRDAALRDARAHGLPEPLTASAQPFRGPRRHAPWLPWTFAAAGLVALAFSGYLYLSNADEPKGGEVNASPAPLPGSEKTPLKGTAAPVAAPEVANAAATEADPASVAARREALGAASAPPPPSLEASVGPGAAANPAPPAPSNPTASSPAPAAGTQGAGGSPTAGERSTRAPAVGTERGFVRVARLGDGGEIRLGGIAWSEVAPLAYLNGQLLGPGETVEGWRVARIERGRVVLERAGESLRISLR